MPCPYPPKSYSAFLYQKSLPFQKLIRVMRVPHSCEFSKGAVLDFRQTWQAMAEVTFAMRLFLLDKHRRVMFSQVFNFRIIVDHDVHILGMQIHVALVVILRGIKRFERNNLRDD